MIKTLLQGGHWSNAAKKVEISKSFDATGFASDFIRIVGSDGEGTRLVAMASGEGAFVIAELCARVALEGIKADKDMLRGWFDGDMVKALKEEEGRGIGALLKSLETLRK